MKDQLKNAVIAGEAATATAMTQALLATGASPREILDEALLRLGRWIEGTRRAVA